MGATACAHGPRAPIGAGGERYNYPSRRDRHAVVFLFPLDGRCRVIGAPETHIAFPSQKMIWRVVNLCAAGTEIEMIFDSRTPPEAPPNPFVETAGVEAKDSGFTFRTRVRNGFAPENTFTRTVKPSSAFRGEAKYFYKVGIKDDPASRIEPEMDIWP
jgi:hypothetical protein